MSELRRIVIIGATSSIALHCAREWLRQGPVDFTLVGRNPERLARVAADLSARSADSRTTCLEAAFTDTESIAGVAASIAAAGAIDTVLIAHGDLPDQRACETDLSPARNALEINGLSPVLFAEAFARAMEQAGRGTLALVGSVAGDRGRKSNYVYGAAKGLVERYAEGLQHRFAAGGVKVVLIKPGPTRTPMTAQLEAEGMRLADVELVARQTVKAIDRGLPVAYVPGRWRLIMLVIRHLPRAIFNRLDI